MFAKAIYQRIFLLLALSLSFGIAQGLPTAGLGALDEATLGLKGKCEQDRHPDHPESCAVNASLVTSIKAPLENDEEAHRLQCSELANACLELPGMAAVSCLDLYEVEGDCDFTETREHVQYMVPAN